MGYKIQQNTKLIVMCSGEIYCEELEITHMRILLALD